MRLRSQRNGNTGPWLSAYEYWKQFIRSSNGLRFPIGVFAVSDLEAYGILLACKELGLRVPEDVGIVGFDDRDLAILAEPSLTTIRQHPDEMGRQAAKLILERMDNPTAEVKHIKIAPELVERQSARRIVERSEIRLRRN